jgi:hypothetical protein
VRAGLVHENQRPTFPLRPPLQFGPRLGAPALDDLLISLNGSSDGDLRGPPPCLEQTRHVALAGGDAELLLDHFDHPSAGPELTPEAVGLRAVPQEVGDQALLGRGQFGSRSRRWPGKQCFRPLAACRGQPPTHRPFCDVQGDRDVALLPALLFHQVQRLHPPPFLPVMRCEVLSNQALL